MAALFAALAGAAVALGAAADGRRFRKTLPGIGVVIGALAPVALLAVAFPEGGTEPFVFSAFWPLPLIAIGLALVIPGRERVLLSGTALYVVVLILSYAVPSAVGSNATRLFELLAGPLLALILWPRRKALLLAAAIPLLYLQWHAPIGDITTAGGPATTNGYYRPLLSFLERQPGPPFRVEIPFTKFHWEAYAVAPQFPLARGWERQLDIKYNHALLRRRADAPRATSAGCTASRCGSSRSQMRHSTTRRSPSGRWSTAGSRTCGWCGARATGGSTRSLTRPRSCRGRRRCERSDRTR